MPCSVQCGGGDVRPAPLPAAAVCARPNLARGAPHRTHLPTRWASFSAVAIPTAPICTRAQQGGERSVAVHHAIRPVCRVHVHGGSVAATVTCCPGIALQARACPQRQNSCKTNKAPPPARHTPATRPHLDACQPASHARPCAAPDGLAAAGWYPLPPRLIPIALTQNTHGSSCCWSPTAHLFMFGPPLPSPTPPLSP